MALARSTVRLLPWSVAAIAVLWVAMSMTYPLGWDQGILSAAGHKILQGGQPYRDAWDMKGPVAFFVFAFSEKIFGVNLWGIRVLDAAALIVTSFSIEKAATRLTSPLVGRWSALIFFVWYASQSYWHTAQPDGWVAMLLGAVLLPALVREETVSLPRLLGAGLAIGLATLVKPLYAIFLFLPWLSSTMRHPSRWTLSAATLAAGWSAPMAVCAAWFAGHNALDDLVAVYLTYPASVYADLGSPGLYDRARGLAEYLLQAPVLAVALPVFGAGAVTLWRTSRATSVVLATWVVVAVGLVTLQGRFFAYHWLPVLPPAVLLGAAGLHAALASARPLALACFVVILAHCLVPIAFDEVRFASWLAGVTDSASYYDGYGDVGDEMRSVRWLKESGRDGKVFVFGWNTGIAWLSGRDIVSRFLFSMPLLIGDTLPVRSAYRDEVLRALTTDPPRYIIIGVQSERIMRRSIGIADFPVLAALVAERYEQVARFGTIRIHERVSDVLSERGGR